MGFSTHGNYCTGLKSTPSNRHHLLLTSYWSERPNPQWVTTRCGPGETPGDGESVSWDAASTAN